MELFCLHLADDVDAIYLPFEALQPDMEFLNLLMELLWL
jgi:hypothetical protein